MTTTWCPVIISIHDMVGYIQKLAEQDAWKAIKQEVALGTENTCSDDMIPITTDLQIFIDSMKAKYAIQT